MSPQEANVVGSGELLEDVSRDIRSRSFCEMSNINKSETPSSVDRTTDRAAISRVIVAMRAVPRASWVVEHRQVEVRKLRLLPIFCCSKETHAVRLQSLSKPLKKVAEFSRDEGRAEHPIRSRNMNQIFRGEGESDERIVGIKASLQHDSVGPDAPEIDPAGNALPAADEHPLVMTTGADSDRRAAEHQIRKPMRRARTIFRAMLF